MKTSDPASLDFSRVILTEAAFLDFAIKRKELHLNTDKAISGFSSHVSVQPSFNVKEKEIKIEIQISCEAMDETHKPLGIDGSFILGFTFLVQDMEEYLIQAPEIETPIPNAALMIPLIGAAYSTARGMIIVKVLGTLLQGFTLPITNARDLLQPLPPSLIRKKSRKNSEKEKS